MKTLYIDNYTYRIGANAKENDQLIESSDKLDTWFHLDDLPSCHGIINCPIDKLSKQIIYLCAINIKKNSKFKKICNVKVVYTQIENIKKTDKLGEVQLLKKCKTILV
uniref:NFACT RNA-binding domain-containing protein n=1 Tax=viral metagenome TaxID=1070528 RepID=A0A6C0IVB4_9ZZZZ